MRGVRIPNSLAIRALAPLTALCAVVVAAGVRATGPRAQAPPLLGAGGPPATAIRIQNFSYAPASIEAAAGTTVTWTNSDDTAHTVTASDGTAFDSGPIQPGASWSFTFDSGGVFPYFCSLHPLMSADVLVQGAGVATYPAGANLIGGPSGTILPNGSVFAYDPRTNSYMASPSSVPLAGGRGYWATFGDDEAFRLPAGSTAPVPVLAEAAHWLLIGNPSGTEPATVSGADAIYTFDPLVGQYESTTMLRPGQGAWAISLAGGTITIAPNGGPRPSATAVVTPQEQTPAPTPTPSATPSPTVPPTRTATPTSTPMATPTPVPPFDQPPTGVGG